MIRAVVVSHDSAAHLGRCLGSLAGRVGGGLEVVVVDNASTDGSAELARRQLPSARVLAQGSNLGFGAAVNLAAASSGGDDLLLLNPDAWLVDDCLDRLAAALAADSGLGAVAPRLEDPDGRPQPVWSPDRSLLGEALEALRRGCVARPRCDRPLERLLRLALGPGWLTAACLLLRRAAFDAVGGFDPGYFLYFEDVDLGLRLRRHGFAEAVVEGARAVHVGGGSRAPGPEVELHYRRSQLRYYRLHRPPWERRLLLRWLRLRHRRPEVAAWLRAVAGDGEPAVTAPPGRGSIGP